MKLSLPAILCLLLASASLASGGETNEVSGPVRSLGEGMAHLDAKISRQLNELLWFQRLNDIAQVDKIRYTGPPPHDTNGLAPPAGSNEVVVSAFTFLPRQKGRWRKLPLLI